MKLVERHIVKDNWFEDICLKSGLLYNYVLYNIRQGVFSGNYLKEFDLSNKLCKENQFDFRNLPNHVSQQVIKQVFKNIKSWMRLKKDFEKNPSKYGNHRPHLPSYKKGKKQNMVVFTNCDCRIKDDGYIHFVKNTIKPIKTNVKKDELKQVRIIPQATCYVVEVVYERKEIDLGLDKDNFLSIDLGLNNLCSCISNVGLIPFIVNGRIMRGKLFKKAFEGARRGKDISSFERQEKESGFNFLHNPNNGRMQSGHIIIDGIGLFKQIIHER